MTGRLSAPKDGIVASTRPVGWPARRWMASFDALTASHHAQLARGRTLARSGRVRDLWFSPGLASAEVVANRDSFRVTIRVRVFDDGEWKRVVRRLLGQIGHIAAMLEGDLPEDLVADLDSSGLPLLPPLAEVDGICDCQDFHMPCSHMAAVHNVVAEALDGDPFLLLTLRGLTREQLLGRLRRAWKDPLPLSARRVEIDEDPAGVTTDWARSPRSLPRQGLRFENEQDGAMGVRALGPAPGRADLAPALAPLYDAGAKACAELAFGDPPDLSNVRPTGLWEGFVPGQRLGERPAPAKRVVPAEAEQASSITERLVDLLAELESAKSKTLADHLDVPVLVVRQELLDLEKLGIVYRTGQTRGTKWWLG
jgi:uncharacterized Zn finger protein